MGRQVGDPTVVSSSSIALLQERFRELQRVKEKRQEKQLLKLFSESERIISPTTTMHLEPDKLTVQTHEMFLPNRPIPSTSAPIRDYQLSLGLNSQSRHADFPAVENPDARSLWGNISSNTASTGSSSSRNFETSDVDTSLHL